MNKLASTALGIGLLLGGIQQASAHVAYTDLSDPFLSPGGVNGGSFASNGWFDGTTTTLGDSHDLAGGTFFKFHLNQASNVSITFSDTFNSGNLNPAFSVYAGLFADEAHDDASVDPLNPAVSLNGPKLPSPVDNGVTTDAFGRVSPFRDTANITYKGQFDALHSWSMANASGIWSVVEYMAHAAPTGGNSVSLQNLFLQAGDYTIAAGGGWDPAVGILAGIDGTISFSAVTAVPAPAALWLLVGGIGGLSSFGRRSRQQA
jgi:hypothetical protein